MAKKKEIKGFEPKKKTDQQKQSDFELMAKSMVTPKTKDKKKAK